jgi:uncharacterized protein (TIGR02145 family)
MRKKLYYPIYLFALICLIPPLGCENQKNEETISVPVLTTMIVNDVTQTTGISGGTITSNGGSIITECGVCWDINQNPLILNRKSSDVPSSGKFTSVLNGLTANTTYYVRAYATNIIGTGYGNVVTFNTFDIMADMEGNTYKTIRIGTQTWMAENLKVTKYRNGDLIDTTDPVTLDIAGETSPKHQWPYEGNESNVATYGRLYTWYAITDNRGICPDGWRVPNDTDWLTLIHFLGGDSVAGRKLKEMGNVHWIGSNSDVTNETGFTAIPGGHRWANGTFSALGTDGSWWSQSENESNTIFAGNLRMNYFWNSISRDPEKKCFGCSVRCIKE